MATNTGLFGNDYIDGPHTYEAAEDIVVGLAVRLLAGQNKQVELCDSQGERCDGVAIESKTTGKGISILRKGRFQGAIAGAAIAALYTPLTPTAAGRFEAAASGDFVCGQNLSTAAADGDVFTIEIDPSFVPLA